MGELARSSGLSLREREIVQLAARGRSIKETAFALQISPRTVETYWSRIYPKTGTASQLELVAKLLLAALSNGGPARRAGAETER